MSAFPDVGAVRRALEHQFSVHGPSVEAAMSVILPVMRRRDAEIERLRGLLAKYVITGEPPRDVTPT